MLDALLERSVLMHCSHRLFHYVFLDWIPYQHHSLYQRRWFRSSGGETQVDLENEEAEALEHPTGAADNTASHMNRTEKEGA
jgi:hypothetical protein